MGVCVGGTLRDLAQAEVLICFAFVPKGTKKNIAAILAERGIRDETMAQLCREEAEYAILRRFTLQDRDGLYVFSKDRKDNYFWGAATAEELKYRQRTQRPC